MTATDPLRIRRANEAPPRDDGDFVLYWMTAARRPTWNHAFDRAVEEARSRRVPLVVLEALRCGYRWASDRMHRFVLQGMADNRRALKRRPVTYHAYVERSPGEGSGLIETLASRACLVITDDFPCFFLPRMVTSVARRLDVALEVVDGNGLLPLRAVDKVYPSAAHYRRRLHAELPEHLAALPSADPMYRVRLPRLDELPGNVAKRWPDADDETLTGEPDALAELPIDHDVGPAAFDGGTAAGERTLRRFLDTRLPRYGEARNEPGDDVTSGLSPYLHFGHVGAAQIFAELAEREGWTPDAIDASRRGAREGWWGMSPAAESFLDELVTWRELGFNMAARSDDYDRYEALPNWARQTLADHLDDEREHVYSHEELELAHTHDELWNAAQRQLVREGRIHNYMRMVWGKSVLQWTRDPREAAGILIELNNKYAVDGRDPNSYSGIFWCLGRYDRPWPERPVLGKVRSMTLDSTRRKLDVEPYLERYGEAPSRS